MIVFGEKLFINPLKKIVAFNFDELKAAFAEIEELKKLLSCRILALQRFF